MELTVTPTEAINQTMDGVMRLSYRHKTEEERINSFLDTVIEIQNKISDICVVVEQVVEMMEKATWIKDNEIDEKTLERVASSLAMLRGLDIPSKKYYISINNNFRKVAKTQVKRYKAALDDLKDMREDWELRFFEFPKDHELTNAFADLPKL